MPDTAVAAAANSRKRRRSSKKISPVHIEVDSSVLDIDWSLVANILAAQLAKRTEQQQILKAQQELARSKLKCNRLFKKRRFSKK